MLVLGVLVPAIVPVCLHSLFGGFDFTVVGYSLGIYSYVWEYLLCPLWLLFFIDFGGGFTTMFKAIWYALKMFFYNLPFFFLFLALVLGVTYSITPFMYYLVSFEIFIFPFWVCVLSVYYTKKVYNQARLYQGT